MCMPSYTYDIRILLDRQFTIIWKIAAHLYHIHIFDGDFNQDIVLIGRQNKFHTTLLQEQDFQW